MCTDQTLNFYLPVDTGFLKFISANGVEGRLSCLGNFHWKSCEVLGVDVSTCFPLIAALNCK